MTHSSLEQETPAETAATETTEAAPAPLPPPPRPGLKKMPLSIGGLMLVLIAWGLFLAIGTAIFRREGEQFQFDAVKFAIVMVMSGLFLGGWLVLLAFYRPRPRRTDLPTQPPEDGAEEENEEEKKSATDE